MKKSIMALILLASFPLLSIAAAEGKNTVNIPLPKAIAASPEAKSLKVLQKIDNVAMGLDAYVISTGTGINSVLYSDKKGDYTIIGVLLGPDGENITQKLVTANQPKVDMNSLMSELKNTKYIEEGKGANPVYVFYDPNCNYCKQFYSETRDMVKNGDILIRWILVGILGNDSVEKSLGILSDSNPKQAFADFMQTGIVGKKKLAVQNQAVMTDLAKTMQMMVSYQIMGTPAIVYKAGIDVQIIRGIPSKKDLNALAHNLTVSKVR